LAGWGSIVYRSRLVVDRDERHWQDTRGGSLQDDAYARPGTRVVLEDQFARVSRALDVRPHMRILDVGCGVGHFIAWLAARAPAAYHGVDVSSASLRRARTTTPGASWVVGDAERLPYRDAAFDRVACNGAAHHFPDLGVACAELHRVLVPGGRLVLFEPVATRFTNGARRLFGHDEGESPVDLAHKHDVGADEVQAALHAVGFETGEARLSDALAYPLCGMYADFPLGRSRAAMRAALQLEQWLQDRPVARRVLALIAWRMLAVAVKR